MTRKANTLEVLDYKIRYYVVTAPLVVPIATIHRGMARLSWHVWLVKFQDNFTMNDGPHQY